MFEPSLVHGSVTTLSPFRYWCQKVLPLVYDNSLSYYELLCKVVEYLNETMENVNTIGENTNALYNSYLELVEYVNDYFSDINVANVIDERLDAMAESGELGELALNNVNIVQNKEQLTTQHDVVGEKTIILSINGVENVCVERVSQLDGTPLTFNVGDKFYKYLYGEYFNVKLLNKNWEITTEIQSLIDLGVPLYFPKGQYSFNAVLPEGAKIVGDNPTIYPQTETHLFKLRGSDIYLKNLNLQGAPDVTGFTGVDAIVIDENWCDHLVLEDITCENFYDGLYCKTRMIWSEFKNCAFIGNFNNGLVINTIEAVNLNTFYCCRFNNNVNYGINIDLTENNDITNNFISCNIEQNAKNRFGITSVVDCAVRNTGCVNFIGCYFEANGTEGSYAVRTYDTCLFDGCSFTIENGICYAYTDSKVTFVSCKKYNCLETVYNEPYSYVSFVNTNFDALNSSVLEYNKKISTKIDGTHLQLVSPIIDYRHNKIDTLEVYGDNQIIYLKTGTYDVTISGDVMWDGNDYIVLANSVNMFITFNNKLQPISDTHYYEIRNIKRTVTLVNDVLQLIAPVVLFKHNEINSILYGVEGQIVYINAGDYDVTISANVMTNGEEYILQSGQTYSFLVINNKLSKIV